MLQLVIKSGVKVQMLQRVSKSDILVSCLKTWQSRKETQHNMQTLDRPLYALIVQNTIITKNHWVHFFPTLHFPFIILERFWDQYPDIPNKSRDASKAISQVLHLF